MKKHRITLKVPHLHPPNLILVRKKNREGGREGGCWWGGGEVGGVKEKREKVQLP